MHVQSLLLNFLSTFKNKTERASVEFLCISVSKLLELQSHDKLAIGFPPSIMHVKLTKSPLVKTKLRELDDMLGFSDGGSKTKTLINK